MSYCTNYGTVIGTDFIDVTKVSIPPGKESRIRKYIEYLVLIYEGKCLDSFTCNDSFNIVISFRDNNHRNAFIEDVNKTIDTGNLTTIDINEEANLYNLITKFKDVMDSISPFLDFVKKNDDVDKNSDKFTGVENFEKALLSGTITDEILESKVAFETFMENYIMGKTLIEKD